MIEPDTRLVNWVTLASTPNQGEFFDHMDRLAEQLRPDEKEVEEEDEE